MKYYAGLDVSMKETFICILDTEGKKVYESRAYSDPKHIYDELTKSGYKLEKAGLESGSLSSYLTKGLQASRMQSHLYRFSKDGSHPLSYREQDR